MEGRFDFGFLISEFGIRILGICVMTGMGFSN